MFKRRARVAGISELLYVTKLLSLLYLRAFHDDDIEEFQIQQMDSKYDFSFKAKVKGKNVAVFIKARHRETLKCDLATYFYEYVHIRQLLHRTMPSEPELLFILYTTAKVGFSDDSVESGFSAKLYDLIGTGGTVEHPYKCENNIEYLTKVASTDQRMPWGDSVEYLKKVVVKDQVTSLAERIVLFITGKGDYRMMLRDEYVLRYHVLLARHVFDVSDIKPDEYRIASFRYDFFENNEEFLILFKDALFNEILKKRRIDPADIKNLLYEYLAAPTDIIRLSKLIGTVLTYNNGQLEFDKKIVKDFRPDIVADIAPSTVKEAVELAAKDILLSITFNVPAPFGNKDLILRGNDARKERRLGHLAWKIIVLLKHSSKIVTIDDSLEAGFLQLNGGIAGTIGNIFVLDDDNTKLMKITDNWESLGTFAKSLYTKLITEIPNLHEYKFCFKGDKFPKLSFDCNEYEENLARDFLNKLLFYCNQADQNGVEEILKNEMEDYQLNQPNYFQVKTDAIFLQYHNAMQKWWMKPQKQSLTRESDLFRSSISNIIENSLISTINNMYANKLQQYIYTFTEDIVRSLSFDVDFQTTVIIIAEHNVLLTGAKVWQHFKFRDHVVLDLKYIAELPTNDRNKLRTELKNAHPKKVLILICDKIDFGNEMKTLEDIAEAVRYVTRTIIIVTNQTSLQIINKNFPEANEILHDKKLSLFDMSKESQESLFETATAIFPGVEIRLDLLLKGWPGLTSVGTDVASAVADKDTGAGSHRTGDEEWNVPGKSQDP